MKVLFLTSRGQDNLEDATLHGLRALLGPDCVDYPRKDVLYRGYDTKPVEQCYGRLFTIWRTLDDVAIDRSDIESRLGSGHFDFVIVGSVHRVLTERSPLLGMLRRENTVVLDGEDHAGLAIQGLRFLYFKRELHWKARLVWYGNESAKWLRLPIPTRPLRIEPIAFSIPAEKIWTTPVASAGRDQRFPHHIVDPELKTLLVEGNGAPPGDGYVHLTEEEYYSDLRRSVFGVTTKRGGWDCLRHYEIAANGAIVCFRDLDAKPARCAPEGLDGTNSLVYRDARDLLRRTETMTSDERDGLMEAAHGWVERQTTEHRAKHLLDVMRRRLA
ncbi:MAG TPA: glycosyltransferase [Planctomycetota bacterium]|nr:glycosyltransferase [Planctomycetota bacterium]